MKRSEVDKDKIKSGLKRAMWMFMALLFVVTGLGVGVLAFWQATHPPKDASQSQNITCTTNQSLQFNTASASTPLAGAKISDFTPKAHISSLSCLDAKVGSTGQPVSSSSTITANYTGALASSGVIFQSSLDNGAQPFTTALNGVIPAWQKGLLGMKAGGERRLLVPSALAYGAQGACETPNPQDNTKCDKYSIPPNTDLVFDVSILAVQ